MKPEYLPPAYEFVRFINSDQPLIHQTNNPPQAANNQPQVILQPSPGALIAGLPVQPNVAVHPCIVSQPQNQIFETHPRVVQPPVLPPPACVITTQPGAGTDPLARDEPIEGLLSSYTNQKRLNEFLTENIFSHVITPENKESLAPVLTRISHGLAKRNYSQQELIDISRFMALHDKFARAASGCASLAPRAAIQAIMMAALPSEIVEAHTSETVDALIQGGMRKGIAATVSSGVDAMAAPAVDNSK